MSAESRAPLAVARIWPKVAQETDLEDFGRPGPKSCGKIGKLGKYYKKHKLAISL